ncbi:MAG: O-antigen polymerase [Paracoccaceae bacterium]
MTRTVAFRFIVVVTFAWVSILLMRSLEFLVIWEPTDDFFLLLIIYCALVALIGYVCGISYGQYGARLPRVPKLENLERVTNMLSFISLVGSVYLIFDFAIVRGYGWGADVNEIRTLEVTGQAQAGGAISGLGRLMAPAVSAAWSIYLCRRREFRRGTAVLLGLAFLAHLYFEMKFTGGRFFLFIFVIQYLLYAHYFTKSTGLKPRRMLFRLAILVAVVVFIGNVFISRAGISGAVLAAVFEASLFGHPAQMSDYLYRVLDTELGSLFFAIAYMWVYLTQGLSQFYVLLTADDHVFGYGFFQFPQLAQIASRLTGLGLSYDVFRNLENPGTYNTLLGAIYVDFGYFGLALQTFIFFFMTGAAIQKLQSGHVTPLSLSATLLMAAALLSPCVNVLTNIWLGVVWLFLISPLISKKRQMAYS